MQPINGNRTACRQGHTLRADRLALVCQSGNAKEYVGAVGGAHLRSLVRMGSHPLPNALDRRFFARNEIALDEGTADRGKGMAVMRVVVDAQRRAVFEDDAPRAFNLKGEQIEWILKPADFKFLAIERAGLNSATVVVRHQLVLLVTAADPCALVGKCFRAGLVTDCDQVGWAAVKRNVEFGTRKTRTLDDRLVVAGQETPCFAQARDAHGLKILFEKGASGIRMLRPEA